MESTVLELHHLSGTAKPIVCEAGDFQTTIGRRGTSMPSSVSRSACLGRTVKEGLHVTASITCTVRRVATGDATQIYCKGQEFEVSLDPVEAGVPSGDTWLASDAMFMPPPQLGVGDELYLGNRLDAAVGVRLQV